MLNWYLTNLIIYSILELAARHNGLVYNISNGLKFIMY